MKKLIYTFILLVFILPASIKAQNNQNARFIEVIGEAEMEVEPDKITIGYSIPEKSAYGEPEEALPELESRIKDYLKKSGVNVAGVDKVREGAAMNSFLKGNDTKYTFTVNSVLQARTLLNGLDSLGAKNVKITNAENTQAEKYKNELEVKAMKNALEQAKQLLAVFSEKPGRVLEVREKTETPYDDLFSGVMVEMQKAVFSKLFAGDGQSTMIKLSYSARVKFEII